MLAKKVGLSFVVADSGMGKSSLCYELMSANGEDTFALHVQPQILESSPGVWELLMNGLIYLDVHLFNNIDMLIEALKNKQVLIIIDDLNRANIIGQLISKAISFINNDPIAGAPPIQIICPVWPRHYSYLEQQKHKTAKFAVHFCPLTMNRKERHLSGLNQRRFPQRYLSVRYAHLFKLLVVTRCY